jgi:hypothetical protein
VEKEIFLIINFKLSSVYLWKREYFLGEECGFCTFMFFIRLHVCKNKRYIPKSKWSKWKVNFISIILKNLIFLNANNISGKRFQSEWDLNPKQGRTCHSGYATYVAGAFTIIPYKMSKRGLLEEFWGFFGFFLYGIS